MSKQIEVYGNYAISFNEAKNRFEAKKGRKVSFHHTTLPLLKSSIDSWNRNKTLSDTLNSGRDKFLSDRARKNRNNAPY